MTGFYRVVRRKKAGWWFGPIRLWWFGRPWVWKPGFTDWRKDGVPIIAGGWLGLEIDWVKNPEDRYYTEREPLPEKQRGEA